LPVTTGSGDIVFGAGVVEDSVEAVVVLVVVILLVVVAAVVWVVALGRRGVTVVVLGIGGFVEKSGGKGGPVFKFKLAPEMSSALLHAAVAPSIGSKLRQ
jgi:hypothetical protein